MSEAIPPLPQYAFMAWCLVEAQGQLYLYILLNVHDWDFELCMQVLDSTFFMQDMLEGHYINL